MNPSNPNYFPTGHLESEILTIKKTIRQRTWPSHIASIFEENYLQDFICQKPRSDMIRKKFNHKKILLISPPEEILVAISKNIQRSENTLAKSIIVERNLRMFFPSPLATIHPRLIIFTTDFGFYEIDGLVYLNNNITIRIFRQIYSTTVNNIHPFTFLSGQFLFLEIKNSFYDKFLSEKQMIERTIRNLMTE